MQHLIIVLGLFLIVHVGTAQESAIQFVDGNWETVLKQAKEQDKLIFVDAYTSWCGPCKKMAKDVFTEESVADFYNSSFINAKIDMEKGEGILFARAYNVRAYPTFLFLDKRGNMVHKALGYRAPKAFVEIGKSAKDPNMSIGGQTEKYKAGNREPEFLKHYAITLAEAMHQDKDKAVDAYLATQEDWLAGDNAEFLFNYSSDNPASEHIKFIVKNRTAFEEAVGKEKVEGKLEYIALGMVDRKDRGDRDALVNAFRTFFPEEGEAKADKYLLQLLMRQKTDEANEKFLETAKDYMSRNAVTDWQLLNAVAWHTYEITDDKAYLKLAKKWAKQSIDIQGNYYNYDTLAAIYYKLGEKEEGLKSADKAIAKAKEAGVEPTETEMLKEKLMAM